MLKNNQLFSSFFCKTDSFEFLSFFGQLSFIQFVNFSNSVTNNTSSDTELKEINGLTTLPLFFVSSTSIYTDDYTTKYSKSNLLLKC